MAGFTRFTATKVLNHILRASDDPRPAATYVGLYTANPTDSGGGTEVTGGSYARVQIVQGTGAWDAPTAADPVATQNTAAVTFPAATANWGTVTGWGLFDASTAGNLLIWSALTTSRVINNGDTASFAAGAIDLTLD